MRSILAWTTVLVAIVVIVFSFLIWRGSKAAATLEPGMVTLQLPAGATAYLRRQAYSGKASEVYISANGDFCAPYDRGHDYKLPQIVQGGSEAPVLISYSGNTVIVHAPGQLQRPQSTAPGSFSVVLEQLTPEEYSVYAGAIQGASKLPKGWVRAEIPFGHNTCAL